MKKIDIGKSGQWIQSNMEKYDRNDYDSLPPEDSEAWSIEQKLEWIRVTLNEIIEIIK